MLGYIRKQDLLRAGDRVGIAISGGADSVALLRVLLELRAELGLVLSLVHLNHRLRGTESKGDERFVERLAARHGLEFIGQSIDVKRHAAEQKLSLEAAARQLRYQFFKSLLQGGELDRIATAHTLDDQAETVLLKLLRGAGTRGLAGIYPTISIQQPTGSAKANKDIVRPLLATRRKHIEAYLKHLRQNWREDSTNRNLRHTRNRIRRKILPEIEKLVNPAACEALTEAAEIARAEEQFWEEQVAHWLPQVSRECPSGVILNNVLGRLGLALRRRLVRAAARSLGLELEFRQVEQVLHLAEGERILLRQNSSAARLKGEIRFERAQEHIEKAEYEYELQVPGKTVLPERGVVLEAILTRVEVDGAGPLLSDRFLQNRLIVRNWRPGDRFWPAHTKAPKKVKELLQDRHIVGDERKRWPVVARGEEIVWMRGFGIRRGCQAQSGKGLLIREVTG